MATKNEARLNVRLPAELKRTIEEAAAQLGQTVSDLAEFDRWKECTADKHKAREGAKRPAFNDESLIRMEKRIGQRLPRLASGETSRAGLLAPGEAAGASNPS